MKAALRDWPSGGVALAAAVGALAAAATLIGPTAAPPATAQSPCAAPPSPSGRALFAYTGTVQHVRVPAGVEAIRVDARGGHGGQYEQTGAGGAGGRVLATVPVVGNECLNVYVGGFGGPHGGFGWGGGGDRGENPVPTAADGAGGGGGSAISRGAPEVNDTPLVIAGGGGGGGGKGDGHRPGARGGNGAGGDGPNTPRGHDGFSPPLMPYPSDELLGGDGGWGGDGANGGDGQSVYTYPNAGAGGGGGSGYKGGDGGLHWVSQSGGDDLLKEVGGGGGGGGSSYAEPSVTQPQYLVGDTSPCPVGSVPAGCHGAVTISWVEKPTSVAPFAGSGQEAVITSPFPTPLQARVTALSGDVVAGVQVTFTLPDAAAGATFDDGTQGTVATAVTNDQGVATSPPLIANRTAGSWTAEATVAGVAEPALYALANEPAPTATAVFASANPSAVGEPVTFTAQVGASPSSVGIPTGRVQFTLDGDDLGGPVELDGAGTATVPSRPLTLGDHELRAVYEGGHDFVQSVASLTQRVERARAAITLTSSEAPSDEGDPVTFTADVRAAAPASGTPTGEVQFRIDGQDLDQPVPLQNGRATSLPPTIQQLPEGRHVIEAVYGGDGSFEQASGTLEQAVGPAATATMVTSSPATAVFGEAVTFTANVTSPAGEDPAGAVDFAIEGEPVGCDGVTLEGGEAQCTPADPLAPGSHVVTASYEPGSVGFEPSQGRMVERVVKGGGAVTVEALPEPTVFGVGYTIHADVAPTAPAAGDPTGAVSFRIDGVEAGDPVPLGDEGATLPSRVSLPAGPHVIEARYGGDQNFMDARGASTAIVDRAVTAARISSSADVVAPGAPVSFDLRLDVLPPGVGDPSGTVQFIVDGVPRGAPVPIDAGGAARSAPVTGLTSGGHDVRASYSGDRNFAPSDATLIQQVSGSASGGPSGTHPAAGGGSPERTGAPEAAPWPTLLCGRGVVLAGARRAGRRVELSGLARPDLVGRRVTLIARERRVGRATVRADGSFAATVPLLGGKHWSRVRYRARVAQHDSAAVAIERPLVVVRERTRAGDLHVTLALADRRRSTLTLGRQPGCLARGAHRLRTIRTDRGGRARVRLKRPPAGDPPSVYRVWTADRKTYSLPIVVRARAR